MNSLQIISRYWAMFSCPQLGELVAVVGDAEPVLERLEVGG